MLAAAVATAAWWLLSNASEPVGLCLFCDDLLMLKFFCRLILNAAIGAACMLGFMIFRSFMKHYQLRLVSIAEPGVTCMYFIRAATAVASTSSSHTFAGCIV
jgi:hypothetical protein